MTKNRRWRESGACRSRRVRASGRGAGLNAGWKTETGRDEKRQVVVVVGHWDWDQNDRYPYTAWMAGMMDETRRTLQLILFSSTGRLVCAFLSCDSGSLVVSLVCYATLCASQYRRIERKSLFWKLRRNNSSKPSTLANGSFPSCPVVEPEPVLPSRDLGWYRTCVSG